MEWTYINGPLSEINLEDWTGFVYIIENRLTGRKYIGKKQLSFSRTSYRKNPKTGKPKKVKKLVESDWRDYYGSSPELLKDVETLGAENFSRTILHFCKTKGELSYQELVEQINNRVLERDDFYNGIIQVRIHKRHIYPNLKNKD